MPSQQRQVTCDRFMVKANTPATFGQYIFWLSTAFTIGNGNPLSKYTLQTHPRWLSVWFGRLSLVRAQEQGARPWDAPRVCLVPCAFPMHHCAHSNLVWWPTKRPSLCWHAAKPPLTFPFFLHLGTLGSCARDVSGRLNHSAEGVAGCQRKFLPELKALL